MRTSLIGCAAIPLCSLLLVIGSAEGVRTSQTAHAGRPARLAFTADTALQLWEQSSRSNRPLARLEREALEHRYTDSLSAFAIATIVDFSNPVTRGDLRKEYRWTVANESTDTLTLKAVPREDLDRLLCGELFVELSRKTWLPVHVRFSDQAGNLNIVRVQHHKRVRPTAVERTPHRGSIRMVSAERTATSQGQSTAGIAQSTTRQIPPAVTSWMNKMARISTLQAEFERHEFDHAKGIQTHARGHFRFDAPDRGRYTVVPHQGAEISKSANAQFTMQSAREERWIAEGDQVLCTGQSGDVIWRGLRHSTTPAIQLTGGSEPFFASPRPALWRQLPLCVGMTAAELNTLCDASIVQTTESHLEIQLAPRQTARLPHREIRLVIDLKTNLPCVVNTVDRAGVETVHALHHIEVEESE